MDKVLILLLALVTIIGSTFVYYEINPSEESCKSVCEDKGGYYGVYWRNFEEIECICQDEYGRKLRFR